MMFKATSKILSLCVALLTLISCATPSVTDRAPVAFSNYLQDDFQQYIKDTKAWITANRSFRSDDKALETALNSPYEVVPADAYSKGILLVHGLSGSPYDFADIAKSLAAKGYLVRTILLPGHGANPIDLKITTTDDWRAIVHHHTELMMLDVDEVWLGGFSTGANLALLEAIDNKQVAGTLLFSPAIRSTKQLDFLAPYAKHFTTWADIDPETSLTRFDSLTMNAAALYYDSAKLLRNKLAEKPFSRPTLFTLSADDSVVDVVAVERYFSTRFSHASNRLVWFGQQKPSGDYEQNAKIRRFNMRLPQRRVSTGSHMAVLYSPSNALYGEHGLFRICNNGQSDWAEAQCEAGAQVWYGHFDYTEANKIHARLTWNPYFEETMRVASEVLQAQIIGTFDSNTLANN